MKIDAFTFFNELELLEIRLEELYAVVDKFVICESPKTFSGRDKPLFFLKNRGKFKEFLDKIHYVGAAPMNHHNPWENEKSQRNAMLKPLILTSKDIVMISDLDEIPRRSDVAKLELNRLPFTFSTRGYYGYLNNAIVEPASQRYMSSIVVVDGARAQSLGAQYWRDQRDKLRQEKSGWHFSYMGGAERIRTKLQSYSHTEFNKSELTDLACLQEAILTARDPLKRGEFKLEIEPVDDSYPEAIKRGAFPDLINPLTK